jgi:hypothetical protein
MQIAAMRLKFWISMLFAACLATERVVFTSISTEFADYGS